MNDEPEVLQLRIQIRTLEGRQRQTRERVDVARMKRMKPTLSAYDREDAQGCRAEEHG